jgi:hypothetical protein
MTTDYNLLDGHWIPVLYRDGRYERVGIRKALEEAGLIRQIAASNPMDNVALLRFLLAVLLWCKDDAKSALAELNDRSVGLHEDWLTKLDDNKTAFNLLGDGARFYQDASLRNEEARPIADLLVEFPGADSINHMRHVIHGSYGFCPACCALGILRLSVWAPANRFYPASVNPGSAAYAVVQASNLLLTLPANLPAVPAQAEQAPWLITEPPTSPGAVANLAWRPRRLWLNVANNGHCAYCGQPGALVKSLCIAKGWPTPVTTGQQFGKDVLAEFQKLNRDYKAKKTDRRKLADKVVKVAPVISKCRMPALLQADSNTAQALIDESDAAKIARIFDQLYTASDHEAIRGLTKKPTKEEQPHLKRDDTQVKKFWVDDPHLLKETEAIGLPDLSADIALHATKFWRDALKQRAARAVAIGIVGDGQYTFHDTLAVPLPEATAAKLASLTEECAEVLRGTDAKERPNEDSEAKLKRRGVLRTVTHNPDRQHPEINAALVLMTPDTEARILAALKDPDVTADDMSFLNEVYQPLVERVIASTARGSPLRRREATARARSALYAAIRKATASPKPPEGGAKPKRTRKKKGGAA